MFSLIFCCLVLAVAVGVNHLLENVMQETALGLKGAVYLGLFLYSGLPFYKLSEHPGK